MPSILLAEDHSVVRMGCILMINDMYPDAVIAESDTFDKALTKIKNEYFDLILLDIHLPGGDSTHMISAIRLRQPKISVLIFSSYEEEVYALRYIDAGADGYISKNAPPEEIHAAIKKALNKEKYLSAKVQNQLLQQRLKKNDKFESILSEREQKVMNLLVKGVSATEIKATMNIRDSTVSTYKANIFKKMGVSNIIELANKLNQLPMSN